MKIELTPVQLQAVDAMSDFVSKKHPQEWFTLIGKAGVGKTTVVIDFIYRNNMKKNIICCALSHKAKSVLKDKADSVTYTGMMSSVNFCTIAAALGMKFNEETGEFVYEKSKLTHKPIDTADIIIVDECSMIDDETLRLIMHMKKHNAKVIFCGDRGQLPPIRVAGNDDSESRTFDTPYKFELLERLRQGEESPILPFSDHYWNSVIENLDYTIHIKRDSIYTDKGNLVFGEKPYIVEMAVSGFKKAIDSRNPNLIKIVCYRNDVRQKMNQYIRQSIYGVPEQFELGDIVMLNDHFEIDPLNIIENGTEFSVLGVEREDVHVEGVLLHTYNVEGDYKISGRNVVVPVVANESRDAYDHIVWTLFDRAKGEPMHSKSRISAFSRAYRVKNMFANLDYSYAITSHKAQGSGYKMVIVYETDILSVYATSLRTKYRSMYTAITRAIDTCVIMR